MNREGAKVGSGVTRHPLSFPTAASWTPGFLIVILVCITSRLVAGDAVAVGYNSEGIWTAVTYYRSSTPKGAWDFKSEKEAREIALADVRKRSEYPVATAKILDSSETTGFVTVARGQNRSGKDETVVGRGKLQIEADQVALAQLNEIRATADQKIVYRYFSYGCNCK